MTEPQVTSSTTDVPGGQEIDVKIMVPTPAGWAPPDLPVVPVDTPDAPPVPASTLQPDVPVITPPAPVPTPAPDTTPATSPGTDTAPPPPPPPPAPAVDLAMGAVVTYTFPETGTGRDLTQTGVVVGHVDLDQGDGTTRPAYRVGWLSTISDPIVGADLVEVT